MYKIAVKIQRINLNRIFKIFVEDVIILVILVMVHFPQIVQVVLRHILEYRLEVHVHVRQAI